MSIIHEFPWPFEIIRGEDLQWLCEVVSGSSMTCMEATVGTVVLGGQHRFPRPGQVVMSCVLSESEFCTWSRKDVTTLNRTKTINHEPLFPPVRWGLLDFMSWTVVYFLSGPNSALQKPIEVSIAKRSAIWIPGCPWVMARWFASTALESIDPLVSMCQRPQPGYSRPNGDSDRFTGCLLVNIAMEHYPVEFESDFSFESSVGMHWLVRFPEGQLKGNSYFALKKRQDVFFCRKSEVRTCFEVVNGAQPSNQERLEGAARRHSQVICAVFEIGQVEAGRCFQHWGV